MISLHKRSGSAFAGLRIGLLGGSFNPAHEAHRAMSLYALKRLGLDQVWWLVSPQNPLKSHKTMASFKARFDKAKKVASHPKIKVSDIEAQLGTRYTFDTLCQLRQRFANTQFVWLMGADNLQQMPIWYKWSEIFHSIPVAVFRRPAYGSGRMSCKAAQRFVRSWRSLHYGKRLAHLSPPAWLVLDNPLNSLSATEIRGQQRGKEEKDY